MNTCIHGSTLFFFLPVPIVYLMSYVDMKLQLFKIILLETAVPLCQSIHQKDRTKEQGKGAVR